jgi:hypothetical protein
LPDDTAETDATQRPHGGGGEGDSSGGIATEAKNPTVKFIRGMKPSQLGVA